MMTSPILSYKFDTSVLGLDSSGNGYTLTNGNVSLVTDSERGPVASFDGNSSRMTLDDTPAGLLGTNFRTFLAWIKPTSTGTSRMIFETGQDSSLRTFRSYLTTTNKLGRDLNGNFMDSGNVTLRTNTWTRVAVVYDGAGVKGYINGTYINQAPARSGTPSTGPGPLVIGGSNFDNFPFLGLMSDFKAYDYALTDVQIAADFIGPFLTPTPYSTFIEVSWSAIDNATSYRLTYDSGSGENVAISRTDSVESTIFNLEPETFYTVRVYSSSDDANYSFALENSATTVPDTEENVNLTKFLNNGVYDFSQLDTSTRQRLQT